MTRTWTIKLVQLLCASATLIGGAAPCAALVIDRNSRGSYDAVGNYNGSGYINEFAVGRICCAGLEARNWLRFDIPILAGDVSIVSATLRTEFNFVSPDSSEVYSLYKVSANASSLGQPEPPNLSIGLPIFQDLGEGDLYGSTTVTALDPGPLSVALSVDALDALNLLAHGPPPSGGNGNWFAIGGKITSLGADRGIEALFCSPDCLLLDTGFNTNFKTELIIECGTISGSAGPTDCLPGSEPSAAPEPATVALLGVSLAGLVFARRRKLN